MEGEVVGVFARGIDGPFGLLLHPASNQLGVVSLWDDVVYFFDLEKGLGDGQLTPEDATAVDVADKCRYISLGRHDNEFIVSTRDGKVAQYCVPNTECTSLSPEILIQGGGDLYGIARLPPKEAFLVADRTATIVYKCSLDLPSTASITSSACSVFQGSPPEGGNMWDPLAMLIDEEKELVYVSCNLGEQWALARVCGFLWFPKSFISTLPSPPHHSLSHCMLETSHTARCTSSIWTVIISRDWSSELVSSLCLLALPSNLVCLLPSPLSHLPPLQLLVPQFTSLLSFMTTLAHQLTPISTTLSDRALSFLPLA